MSNLVSKDWKLNTDFDFDIFCFILFLSKKLFIFFINLSFSFSGIWLLQDVRQLNILEILCR